MSAGGVHHVKVSVGEADQRLDRWVKQHYPDVAYGRLAKWLRTGQMRVDGKRAKPGQRLEAGQEVRVPPMGEASESGPARAPRREVDAEAAADLRTRVLFSDDRIIVLDKPAGLAVQGGTGTTMHLDAMLDALRFGAAERPRLVHRLDRDTSGVLVLARDAATARHLTGLFRGRDMEKVYWALVAGIPTPPEGRIEMALEKRGGRGAEKMRQSDEGQHAVTDFRVLERHGKRVAWLDLRPRTGRTHQLRAHCAAIGTPILGDGKYGGRDAFLPDLPRRLHLHARSLSFPDPETGRTLSFTAPLDEVLTASWRRFGFIPD